MKKIISADEYEKRLQELEALGNVQDLLTFQREYNSVYTDPISKEQAEDIKNLNLPDFLHLNK